MIETPRPGVLMRDLETPVELSVSYRERLLLILAGLFVFVAHTSLIVARRGSILDYWHVAVWIGCALAGHVALHRRVPRRDPFLFPIVMLLSGWGLALINRLAPPFAVRQTVWLIVAVGALVAVIAAPGNLRWLSRYRYLWLFGGLVLLALTIVIGQNPSGQGPRLWLGIPDVYFQPSELLKVLLVAFLASYMADNRVLLDTPSSIGPLRVPPIRFFAPLVLMWGISVLVVLWQADLGTATLFFVVFLAMLYLASGDLRYVLGGLILLAVASVVGYLKFDVVKLRVDVWYWPWNEVDTRAFQIAQSLLAFSAGGVFGQGLAQGSPTYVPVVHSDFVFAAVGEEWGLLGTLAVTGCMALLVMRGLRVAAQTETRPFRSFLAAGLSITFATQSLLIMGGVLKLVPLTGVTLPFLSYGGSSLVVSFIMIGLLAVLSGEP
jgi:cell division protein FtsW (lipid II flippase)